MAQAARPWRPTGVPAKRCWQHRSVGSAALPRPSRLPPVRPAADGPDEGRSWARTRGEVVDARGRRERGCDGAEAVLAAEGNAVAGAGGSVGYGVEGLSGLVVAWEERGSGGGELERKRGLAPAAPPRRPTGVPAKRGWPHRVIPAVLPRPSPPTADGPAERGRCERTRWEAVVAPRPPPKRRELPAKRQFRPGYWRDVAAPITAGGGAEDGLRVGAAPYHGIVKSRAAIMESTSQRNMVVNCGGSEANGFSFATGIAQVHGKGASNANRKSPLVTLHRSFSKGKESAASTRESLAPRKKLKVQGPVQSKHLPMNVAFASALVSKEKLKGKEVSNLEDHDTLKALAVHEGKLDSCLDVPPRAPSVWHHRPHGGQNGDARSKVEMMRRKFQFICRTLVAERSLNVRRVDFVAVKVMREIPGFTKPGPIVGNVPGVEVGDEFLYRVELAIVGLHRLYRGGIDITKDINAMPIAISIVASGGYPDKLSSSGELIYTGSGGKAAGKKEDEDQKLKRGNLALKNCIKTKTPVRVIHNFKGQNREERSHSNVKHVSKYTYDGLYLVVDCWREGLAGSRVFKYRLQKMPVN